VGTSSLSSSDDFVASLVYNIHDRFDTRSTLRIVYVVRYRLILLMQSDVTSKDDDINYTEGMEELFRLFVPVKELGEV